MALFFVEYELRNKRDYPSIISELESYGAVRVLNSYWSLKRTNTSAKALRDHFVNFIDNDDALMVTEVTTWASTRVQNTPNDI